MTITDVPSGDQSETSMPLGGATPRVNSPLFVAPGVLFDHVRVDVAPLPTTTIPRPDAPTILPVAYVVSCPVCADHERMLLFSLGIELDRSAISNWSLPAQVNKPKRGIVCRRPVAMFNTPIFSPTVSSRNATREPSGLKATWAVMADSICRAEAALFPVERTTSNQPVTQPPPPATAGGNFVGWKTASVLPSRDQAAGTPSRRWLRLPAVTTTYWAFVAAVWSHASSSATAPDGPETSLS